MTAERDSMTLNRISYSAQGVQQRSDDTPTAGCVSPSGFHGGNCSLRSRTLAGMS